MPIELRMLFWSSVLGLLHLVLSGMASSATLGMAYGVSARDAEKKPGGIAGRLQRAYHNFLESFPIFAAATLLAMALDRHGSSIRLGAQIYFWARLVYIPLYVLGVPVVRSLVWGVSIVGIAMVLAGSL